LKTNSSGPEGGSHIENWDHQEEESNGLCPRGGAKKKNRKKPVLKERAKPQKKWK